MLSVVPAPAPAGVGSNPAQAQAIALTIKAAMAEMNDILIERETQVELMWACLVARHHMVQIGGAGSAKSLLTTEMIRRIGPGANGEQPIHFLASMHPLMKDEELFGGTDFAALKQSGIYRHHTDRMLPEAHVATLDEVFNASGAILKTTMRILNERQFKNGPDIILTPLMSCFGTSNQLPSDPTLAALWDRFLGRIETLNLSEAGRATFQQRRRARRTALAAPPVCMVSMDDLTALQAMVPDVTISPAIDALLLKVWTACEQQGIGISVRRMGWAEELLAAHALIQGRMQVVGDDLQILEHVLWNRMEERTAVNRILASCISPLLAQLREIADKLNREAYLPWKQFMGEQGRSTIQVTNECVEAFNKYGGQKEAVERIVAEAHATGAGVAQIDRIYATLKAQSGEISAKLQGF